MLAGDGGAGFDDLGKVGISSHTEPLLPDSSFEASGAMEL